MIGRHKPPPPPPKLFGLRPMPKQKRALERLWRAIERRFARKTPAQYVEAFHAGVTSAFRQELSGKLAAALLAKKTLDTTRQVEKPFPDRFLDAVAPVDEAARTELEDYARALADFHDRCIDADTALGFATAQGVETWIASIYGLTRPELTPKVREAWIRLAQSTTGVEEAFQHLMRRAPSDVERQYFLYRPKALMP